MASKKYDYLIIGGGIVGLSTGMNLCHKDKGASVAILEKEKSLAFHQSGRNSGVLHSGIYYKPGSLKATLCRKGRDAMVSFCQENGIEYDICGKVIVATTKSELPLLDNIFDRGIENNIKVKKLSAEEVSDLEPHVKCLGGIQVFDTGITNYKKVSEMFAKNFQQSNGQIFLGTEVLVIIRNADGYVIQTDQGVYETKSLINCSGLFSDRVTALDRVKAEYKIVPFRGEYYELKPEKRYLVNSLIYPVPNPNFPFLGVHFTRMIDGSVHAGPNAVLSLKREGYRKTDFNFRDFTEVITYPGFWRLAARHANEGVQEMIRSFSKAAFVKSLQQLIPEVRSEDLVPTHAGVRAQAIRNNGKLVDDFLIIKDGNSVHVCNAPSPAATSSLEIGKIIATQASI